MWRWFACGCFSPRSSSTAQTPGVADTSVGCSRQAGAHHQPDGVGHHPTHHVESAIHARLDPGHGHGHVCGHGTTRGHVEQIEDPLRRIALHENTLMQLRLNANHQALDADAAARLHSLQEYTFKHARSVCENLSQAKQLVSQSSPHQYRHVVHVAHARTCREGKGG